MAPFVPDIISDELNLIVALIMGICFGIVLEQAGFSSSRKLAGVFYGYDFTVLRVFFTAGITAALGVVVLGFAGLLDLDAIYINPTFLGPGIVGGCIMGVGFVLGGYCPGTSVCAAAIGKKDALAFVFGGIIGVFVFGELFPLYDAFYVSGSFGPLRVFSSLGLSQGVFLAGLVVVAVAAFMVTTKIERKVNPASDANGRGWPSGRHVAAATGLLVLAGVALFLPDRRSYLKAEVMSAAFQRDHPVREITADELAFRILDKDPTLVILDIRTAEDYKKLALPGSVNLTLDGLFGKDNAALLTVRHRERVIVDKDGTAADTAALLAARLGYENVRVLQGGISSLDSLILRFKRPDAVPPADLADTYRFREKASVQLAKMIEENRTAANKPKAAVKKIQGGC